jgi:hypothetical protein
MTLSSPAIVTGQPFDAEFSAAPGRDEAVRIPESNSGTGKKNVGYGEMDACLRHYRCPFRPAKS